jgi:beta-1,4-galactosyltransferase 1
LINLNKATFSEINKQLKHLNIQSGGQNKPSNCKARHRVAIIIPYRDRYNNLTALLRHLHPILNKQQIDYGIYVVEPIRGITFNRALLMNIGFVFSLRVSKNRWQCFIFHVS